MNGYCKRFICKVNKTIYKSTSRMLVQCSKEHLFQNERVTFSDGSVGDLVVGSSEGVVHSSVGSVAGLLVGSVARETEYEAITATEVVLEDEAITSTEVLLEDDAITTTELLLGKAALSTGVAPLIIDHEDEKM